MRRTWIIGATAALALAMSACGSSPSSTGDSEATTAPSASATAGEPAGSSTGDPNAIAAIGHSSVTGYNSDNADLTRDAHENSWATGTNPEVNSLYARILARNPAIKDHNRNAAEDGSTVDDLRGQIDTLLASDPKPDLVLVTSVDNDIRCDGTDPENYDTFGAELTKALRALADGAPQARIFLVSQWATVQAYTDAIKDDPVWREDRAGDGPCDLFDVTRVPQPARIAYLQDIVDHYHAELAASCAQIPACRYDQGAMQRMTVVPADLTSDGSHLSVQGHRKHAELTWAALQEAGLVEPG